MKDILGIIKALANQLRLQILMALNTYGQLSYVELGKLTFKDVHFTLKHAGTFNYHLKVLLRAGLIAREGRGSYVITERGRRALKLLPKLLKS